MFPNEYQQFNEPAYATICEEVTNAESATENFAEQTSWDPKKGRKIRKNVVLLYPQRCYTSGGHGTISAMLCNRSRL